MIERRLGACSTIAPPIDPHRRNVVVFPGSSSVSNKRADPFGQLTARLIIAQYRAGTLQEGVLVALLEAATGLRP
jgi:hypothetical protein